MRICIGEAAQMLGVSTKTLRRWEERGYITPYYTLGGQRRYEIEEISKMADNTNKPVRVK